DRVTSACRLDGGEVEAEIRHGLEVFAFVAFFSRQQGLGRVVQFVVLVLGHVGQLVEAGVLDQFLGLGGAHGFTHFVQGGLHLGLGMLRTGRLGDFVLLRASAGLLLGGSGRGLGGSGGAGSGGLDGGGVGVDCVDQVLQQS